MSIRLYVLKQEYCRLLELLKAFTSCTDESRNQRAIRFYRKILGQIIYHIQTITKLLEKGDLIFY